MNAAIGAVLMASAIVVFAWTYGQYRRPDPARWTQSETATVGLTLAMMALLTFGGGFVLRALIAADTLSIGLLDGATIAGALALAAVLVPVLTRPGRAARVGESGVAVAPGAAAAMPAPANESGPPARPAGAGGKAGKARRAA